MADLGIDMGPGTAAARPTAANRRRKGAKRAFKSSILARRGRTKAAARLTFSTGALAQSRYDMKTAGAPMSVIQTHRRQAGQALSPGKSGRCLTTLLSLVLGPARDPGVSIPCDQLLHWFKLLQMDGGVRRRARLTWPAQMASLRAMPPAQRWQAARGGIQGRVICSLLDLGWTPEGPWCWVDPTDTRWALDEEEIDMASDWSDVMRQVSHTAQLRLWHTASFHRHAEGLGDEIPLL